MTVYFIGAGPGAADLITIRGRDLIRRCGYCLYAGSLVPPAIIKEAKEAVKIIDTAPLTLGEIMALIKEANAAGLDVARVHSGDPSLYGAIAEQIRALRPLGIAYEIIPGVTAFTAAAARLGIELTIPNRNQTVILTRTTMKATPMPEGETLATLSQSRALLVIHLSIRNLRTIMRTLTPYYGEDCPVIIAVRVGWEDEMFIHGNLNDIFAKVRQAKITRTALIFVGHSLTDTEDLNVSALYDAGHTHIFRHSKTPQETKALKAAQEIKPKGR
ncbi:MAG: precorrin-4 C(11)-methyltransferase [Proteobacteria bacterium]|nr:precorrin-4 C(11)-methyltransferase [Pseudomonadota bacterium]